MVHPSSHRISRVRRYSGYRSPTYLFTYRTLTFFGLPSHAVQLKFVDTKCGPKPHEDCSSWFSLLRFRSPLLTESRLISFPRPTQMFQFRRFPSYSYEFTVQCIDLTLCGFLHSDICGSYRACQSPQLFAAYRVLLRLLMPRHPSRALISLTYYLAEIMSHLIYLTQCFIMLNQQKNFVFQKLYYPLILD